jgi:hypothetical protein
MAFKIKQPKVKIIHLSKLPKWKRYYYGIKYEPDLMRQIGTMYSLRERAREKGTIVTFGKGEERFGIITEVLPNGVHIQEFREPTDKEEWGLKKVGTPFFAEAERFRKHLGEKGAIGIDVLF